MIKISKAKFISVMIVAGLSTPVAAAPMTEAIAPADDPQAQTSLKPVKSGVTGATLPRFVSMSASEVNLRSGPGQQYPIQWIYHRENLPVEVTAEYGSWRKIKDMDGTEGWVDGNLLSEQRAAVVVGKGADTHLLYSRPETTSRPLYRIQVGAVAKAIICEEAWCQINAGGKTGWILRGEIWGTYPGENFN